MLLFKGFMFKQGTYSTSKKKAINGAIEDYCAVSNITSSFHVRNRCNESLDQSSRFGCLDGSYFQR
jgi:hypothetical protein